MGATKRRWGWLRFWGEQDLFFGPTFGCCARREKRGTEQTWMASAGVNGKGNFIIKPELEIRTSWGAHRWDQMASVPRGTWTWTRTRTRTGAGHGAR